MFATFELELDAATADAAMLNRADDLKRLPAGTEPLVYAEDGLLTTVMASMLTKTRVGYGEIQCAMGGYYLRRTNGNITWMVRVSETKVMIGYIGSRRNMKQEIFLSAFINDPDVSCTEKFRTGNEVGA